LFKWPASSCTALPSPDTSPSALPACLLQVAYQQRVMGADADDRVAVNFFGDGTCNVGACLSGVEQGAELGAVSASRGRQAAAGCNGRWA
jgi:hypothetical protein